MLLKFVLLILQVSVLAKLDLFITGQLKKVKPIVVVFDDGLGDHSIITNTERITFKLTDSNIYNAAELEFGKRPDDVFVHSPTRWGDLYYRYNWEQVTRNLRLQDYKLLNISSTPVIISQQFIENNTTKPTTTNVAVSKKVRNTVLSFWNTEGELSVGRNISYLIKLDTAEEGDIIFNYSSPWGENTVQTHTVTIGSASAMKIFLEPGQSVLTQLHATRNRIVVNINYTASLSGLIALNYAEKHMGHHFRGFDVDNCINLCQLSNRKRSGEIIAIEFYTRPKLVIIDDE